MLIFLESLELEQTDKEFIVWLYHEYKGLMYYTAKKYISFPEEIEDILQDSIIKLIERIELLRDMEKHTLAGYIAATIRNTSFNYLKKQAQINKKTYDEEINENEQSIPLEDLLHLKERSEQLIKVWPQLSAIDRHLLEGKYILGYSNEELAQQLGYKPSSIRMKMTRGRRCAFTLLMQSEGGVFDDKT